RNTPVSAYVVSVEIQADAPVATTVEFFRVNDRIQLFIDQARLKFAAGVQEVMAPKFRLVGPLFVAIPQRKVQFSGDFTSPFFPAFLLGFLNGLFDGGQGFLVALRDHNADTVFRLLALDS